MQRTLLIAAVGLMVCSVGWGNAQEDTGRRRERLPLIRGTVKKVDRSARTVTLTTEHDQERTFKITDRTRFGRGMGRRSTESENEPAPTLESLHEGMRIVVVLEREGSEEVRMLRIVGGRHGSEGGKRSTERRDTGSGQDK